MMKMTQTFASPLEMAPDAVSTIEQALHRLPKPAKPLPNSFRSDCGDSLPPLPRTRLSVMAVMDDNGYLMPLCTAADLLRWCKAAWRAELD